MPPPPPLEPTPLPVQQPPSAGAPYDEAAAQRVIRAHARDMQHCYEARLEAHPGLHGRVEVAFFILPSGGVDGPHATSNDTGDAQLAECLVARVAALHFDPAPTTPTALSFPFVFSTAE